MANDNPSFMSGIPELIILRLLRDTEMYGYEIVQAISARTGTVITPGEGVVYPVLHGLEKDGALKSRRKTVNGRSRVYYTLTAKGAKRLSSLATHWSALNGAVQAVFGSAMEISYAV
ncbi:MAG TPA: PadR family transcriptional regulator [Rhizomicrobium sp.]|jgi:PadR family transcriptional regulator PadR